jgi:hypothetical protein
MVAYVNRVHALTRLVLQRRVYLEECRKDLDLRSLERIEDFG